MVNVTVSATNNFVSLERFPYGTILDLRKSGLAIDDRYDYGMIIYSTNTSHKRSILSLSDPGVIWEFGYILSVSVLGPATEFKIKV